MTKRPAIMEQVLAALTRLPGVGPKSAERMLFALLKQPRERLRAFARALEQLPDAVVRCSRCGTIDGQSPCSLCSDRRRDQGLLCIVAEATDIRAIEKTGQFHGLYHVLQGLLNPIEGVTPDQLSVPALLRRLSGGKEHVREIILALNPNVEGETTSLYLRKALKRFPVRVSKLARGLPLGGELEYADEITLGDAILGRRDLP